MSEASQPLLPLTHALTIQTQHLCAGLEQGCAPLLEQVTPTTARLLLWWFGEEACTQRNGLNFHVGQKQAILNSIVAHEVLGKPDAALSLAQLYEALGLKKPESSLPMNHPKYCMKMATGTGKTWVLMAMLIWQMLNKTEAFAVGQDDARFTRQFLIVAPGLIVYERLLDAFCGKLISLDGEVNGSRDFDTSEFMRCAALFMPDEDRDRVLAFVRGNVCAKTEIGLKATGNGMIAITNWHLLMTKEEADAWEMQDSDDTLAETLNAEQLDAKQVVAQVLPLSPGTSRGNTLETLDQRYARGNVLTFLAELPELMVFNDEAHHIHEVKRVGETTEVEWQRSLNRIAQSKGQRFVQMDFSATPYNAIGGGKNKSKLFFPHIVVDFDLNAAMRAGLVKSLVLDKRQTVGAVPLEMLDFKAHRDADGNVRLSDGQELMLRAGLTRLKQLEQDFASIAPHRRPKMLVMCEDTKVTPLVEKYLCEGAGLLTEEVMTIDSGKKAELDEKQWNSVRERLFNVDKHATPKVLVSVLMLREGFDVNNVCVIVPLRSSEASILLEQTIGRGLRLMWREPDYTDIKKENRERINQGQEPTSLLDVLTIVEHPAFNKFYEELKNQGLAVDGEGEMDDQSAVGDMMSAGLRHGYEAFDFGIPFIVRESDELRDHADLDVSMMPCFAGPSLSELKERLGKGVAFIAHDLQSDTLFGGYRVSGVLMNVEGYNELLSRLTYRISQALNATLGAGKQAMHQVKPYMQVNTADLMGWVDDYIWTRLFNQAFNPLEDENWRVLLLKDVLQHITMVMAEALRTAEQTHTTGETEVHLRYLSEVDSIVLRQKCSVEVSKCIYTRQGWPSHSGGLEQAFLKWAQSDSQVLAFCKISETRHTFVRLRYVREDGLPAFYSPDFLVRTKDAAYLVETKAQNQLTLPNVKRKRTAALVWCERINQLSDKQRKSPPWYYVILGSDDVNEWRNNNARLVDLLRYKRLVATGDATLQGFLI